MILNNNYQHSFKSNAKRWKINLSFGNFSFIRILNILIRFPDFLNTNLSLMRPDALYSNAGYIERNLLSSPCNISRRFDAVTVSWLTPFRISETLGGNLALVMKLRGSRESSLKPDQDVLMRGNFDFNLNAVSATWV